MSIRISALLVLGSLLPAASAHAGIVTLTMANGNGGGGAFNTTAFSITNLVGPDLTQVSFTVGDTQYLFDQLYLAEESFAGGNGTQAASLLVGDRNDDNAGPDLFTYGFTNFGAGMTFSGQWDIDNDNGDFNADMRNVFFNNGAAPNAVVTFTFSDGSSFSYVFSDMLISQDSYTFTLPSPGAVALLGLAGGLASRRRR